MAWLGGWGGGLGWMKMSNPSIMYKAQLRDGSWVMVDDFRQVGWRKPV